jgi:hypothetical protein
MHDGKDIHAFDGRDIHALDQETYPDRMEETYMHGWKMHTCIGSRDIPG